MRTQIYAIDVINILMYKGYRMTTRAELLKMFPRDVFNNALKDGLGRARKMEGFGLKEKAVAKWYKGRPEYNHPDVKKLIDEGNRLEYNDAIAEIRGTIKEIASSGIDVQPITLVSFSDQGMGTRAIDLNKNFSQTQPEPEL